MAYHHRFNNLHRRAVAAVDETAPRIWNISDEEALEVLRDLASELADIYEVPTPAVGYGNNLYSPESEHISVTHPSLVSFLHEFRHHMQQYGRQANDDVEEDARGWSISMFATAEPEYFDRAWRDDRIMFMPPYEEAR